MSYFSERKRTWNYRHRPIQVDTMESRPVDQNQNSQVTNLFWSWYCGSVVYDGYLHPDHRASGKKKLGFNYSTPETPMGEPFLITKVIEGKAIHLAGLRKGDVIRFGSTRDLYKLIIHHQGKGITIPIARNGKEIDINLKVPEIRLMVVKFSFL